MMGNIEIGCLHFLGDRHYQGRGRRCWLKVAIALAALAMMLLALPLARLDLKNPTLAKAAAGDAKHSFEDKEHAVLFAMPFDSKLLERRKAHLIRSTSLDSATFGKGKPERVAPKKDPFTSFKAGMKLLSASATAASIGEAVTLPLDTAKVRLQTQAATVTKYTGLFGTLGTVAKDEGLGALWKGLTPGIHRQVVYGGLRFGLYDPVRNTVTGLMCGKNYTGNPPLKAKILSGLLTGAFAMAVASPTDLVKVRMQTQKAVDGIAPKYPDAMAAYGIILKEEGLPAMWNGVVPNMMRNAIVNTAELATYDQFKESLMELGMSDGALVQSLSALSSAVVAVLVGSPVDVMKSRMMSDTTGRYRSMFDCFGKTLMNEGFPAFYRGFSTNCARVGGYCVVTFLSLEQIKEVAGLKPTPAPKTKCKKKEHKV